MVPKQRHTKSRRNRQRSHQALKRQALIKCAKCSQLILPHRVCGFCGFYKNKEVIDVMARLTKKERKKAEKAQQEQQEQIKQEKKRAPLSLENLSRKNF
ncbi:MAG: 50S ribosomal protein L32 [Candidatus Portnoybacteria bacterium CG23_combo_of_CG06-09_8_20_14_all_37_13]|uniref:Large ribosomal subunit protein bL32 n=2 Tax=Parcubacteria group TaxID=1794811 RepID=A0A1J4TV54_9BACT|nr:MAG: hypothetical protein AUJ29_03155 [Candidatus Kuenenbacteria bacterium CG1_02_38_13]PIP16831.1 MAG: 50S ribosomal protein L32 [Candidatus Portnoybacteria bacterium CG23_combo_of_CG06-09_8_20_14_all_37_13]